MSISKSKNKGLKVGRRMSREEWLAHALDALEKEGGGALTIDKLSRRLGVSRGSFYWHFKDRTDFIRQLVDHWSMISLSSVDSEVDLPELVGLSLHVGVVQVLIALAAAPEDVV